MANESSLTFKLFGHDVSATKTLEAVGEAADKAGKKLTASLGGMAGAAKAGAAGAGLAAGAALVAGVGEALEQGQLNAKLGAQLGLSKEDAEKAGKLAGQVYADGFGTDVGQVNEAIKGVYQNIGEGNEAWTQKITSQVLSVANTFDQDLGGTTAAVGQMLKTGLAKDATEALDIITAGFQKGADKSGDLLDTFNEYGTQFRKFGLDGKISMGLLSQGLQAGARDADVVADAIKEFSIKSQEDIETFDKSGRPKLTTMGEAFKTLGFDGHEMQAKIAKGGDGATVALDEVLERLRGMKDPTERAKTAVALFGTQAEDLGDALYSLDPSSAVAALGQVEGAAKRVGDTMQETAGAKIERFKRSLTQGFVEGVGAALGVLEDVGKKVGPVFEQVGAKALPILRDIGAKVMPPLRDLWSTIETKVAPAFEDWLRAILPVYEWLAKKLMPAVGPIFNAIVSVIKGALQIIVGIVKVATAILTGDWGKAWEGIKSILSGAMNIIKGVISAALTIVKTLFSVALGAIGAIWGTALNRLKSTAGSIWEGIKGLLSAGWNWISTNVFARFAAGVGALGTAFGRAKDAIATAWAKVREAAAAPVRFVVNTVFGGIANKFNELAAKVGIPRLPVPSVAFAAGGPVPWNLGRRGADSVHALLMPDEHVWTTDEVAGAGGHAAVQRLRELAAAGQIDLSGDSGTAVVRRADGGPIDPRIAARIGPTRAWIPGVDPLPYIWGGVGPNGYDCSGLVGEVWARLTGRASYRRYMTTNTILDSPGMLGLARGPGLFSIGVSRTHTAGNLAGLGFEAASSRSGIRVGSAAKSVGSFPSVFHLASLGTAGADLGGGGFDPLGWVKGLAKQAVDGLTAGWFRKLEGMGVFGQLGVGAAKKILSGLFDDGGLLLPGVSLVQNRTGGPEAVLNRDQWRDISRVAAASMAGRGGGGDLHVHVTLNNAVMGSERQVAKYINETVQSAMESGTLRRFAVIR